MAIQGTFNLTKAVDSQAYAYKCWYNYNYGNNTMGISASDIGVITQTWQGELENWQATAMDDENAYIIEDDDFDSAKDSGKSNAQDKTGYDGKNGKNIVNVSTSAALAAGSGVAGTISAGGVVNAAKDVGGLVKKGGIGSFGKTAAGTKGSGAAKASAYVAAGLAIANVAKYFIARPNKEGKEACDALQDEMINADNALYAAQEEMAAAGEEVAALSDEAAVYNEDANEVVEETQGEYEFYKRTYDTLMAKVEAGEPLTEEEKTLLQEILPVMQELGIVIEETSEDTANSVTEVYDTMGEYQQNYDTAAETVGEVQGLTDYAESFDQTTRNSCYVEGASQSVNAVSAAVAGAQLMGMGFWNWALGIASIAAGVTSGVQAAEQFKWAGEIGTEIEMRKNTQDLNLNTNDIYDESIDGYEGTMATVEELSITIPEEIGEVQEEMEVPEETPAIPEGTNETSSASTGSSFGIPAPTPDAGTAGTPAAASTGFGIPTPTPDEGNQDPAVASTGFGTPTPVQNTPTSGISQEESENDEANKPDGVTFGISQEKPEDKLSKEEAKIDTDKNADNDKDDKVKEKDKTK